MKKLMTAFFGPAHYELVKVYLPKEAVKKMKVEKTKKTVKKEEPVNGLDYYVDNLAKKAGWKYDKMLGYLQNLWELNPSSAFSILLKEVAVELDKKYTDHINNCNEVFVISMMDGRIHKVPKAHIKNFRNFAAFRTEEEAKVACKILRYQLKEMFSGRK